MNFFDNKEIDLLTEYSGKLKTDELQKVYNELQKTYIKVEYWASEVTKQIFPNGKVKITKKPTNQANVFEFYQWGKIYPTTEDYNNKILAYTVSIEKNEKLLIKIDSVGLLDNNPLRKKYYQFRKENPIYKEYFLKDFSGWDELVNTSIKDLISFEPYYTELKNILLAQTVVNINGNESEKKKEMISLNQILYGPPGTGKTYQTINKAVAIANPNFDLNQEREILKAEYNRLVEVGQIMFTTFHQSMSYEDFVEGIKPIMNEEEGEVNYEIQSGIFKDICKIAENNNEITIIDNFDVSWERLIELVKEKIANEKLLKIGSWEYGLSSKDSLKYSSLNSPSQYTFTITKKNVLDTYQNKLARPSGAFKKDMEDIVKYMKTNFQLSNYNDNIKTVKDQNQFNKNFVLIIDEINRGNVSQIFGELITLIEESKRLGKDESLEIILPYSKEKFGVPSNLYIIGTMNTADRSVESLDTALRRRFSFEEMMPDLEILKDIEIGGINMKNLLSTINKRVEVLLDRDHTIGHSYFLHLKSEADIKNTFKNNIIPLLQEYFYGDYEKIGMILGQEFFEVAEKYNKETFANFSTQNYPEAGSFSRLKIIDSHFDIIKALKVLLKIEQVIYE